jgi:hypothetical protein
VTRLRTLCFVALAVLLAAGAVTPAVTAPPAGALSAGGRRVYVYGDSVLLGAQHAIEQRLATKGWQPTVFAHVGASMPQIIDLLRSQQGSIPDVVVLGVGNNYFGNPEVFRNQIDDTMALLSQAKRVIWLSLREFRPDRHDANAELNAAAQRWPTLEIADWNQYSLTQPNVFYADGLHLKPGGAALMAQLVDQRLDAYLAGDPPAKVPVTGDATGPLAPKVYGFGRRFAALDHHQLDPRPRLVAHHSFAGVASTRSGKGYWLAGSDGGVFAFGDAKFHGSAGKLPLTRPIVGIASTRSGHGYWLVAADGGVFTYGDAKFYGSAGALRLSRPVVGIARTPSGRGYWLVASDGGVFAYGDAKYHGSTARIRLAQPVIGITATRAGYYLAANDGGVFAFGDAKFEGSITGPQYWPVVGLVLGAHARGYYLVTADGVVHRFGEVPLVGGRSNLDRRDLFVGATRRPRGYWLLAQRKA